LRQFDLPTALEHKFINPRVVPFGNDVDLVFKVAGSFFATMQLEHFPVDFQRLCLVLAVNCASEGIVPVRFHVEKDAIVTVARGTFALSNLWELHGTAMVEIESVQPMPKTTYPALRVSALVSRKPAYIIAHVIVPMSSLTFLGLLQFLLPSERQGTNVTFRITYSVTILLTTATYKLFVASALPWLQWASRTSRCSISMCSSATCCRHAPSSTTHSLSSPHAPMRTRTQQGHPPCRPHRDHTIAPHMNRTNTHLHHSHQTRPLHGNSARHASELWGVLWGVCSDVALDGAAWIAGGCCH
jgi:hypothetical protein